jgi:hypothetical protein
MHDTFLDAVGRGEVGKTKGAVLAADDPEQNRQDTGNRSVSEANMRCDN